MCRPPSYSVIRSYLAYYRSGLTETIENIRSEPIFTVFVFSILATPFIVIVNLFSHSVDTMKSYWIITVTDLILLSNLYWISIWQKISQSSLMFTIILSHVVVFF